MSLHHTFSEIAGGSDTVGEFPWLSPKNTINHVCFWVTGETHTSPSSHRLVEWTWWPLQDYLLNIWNDEEISINHRDSKRKPTSNHAFHPQIQSALFFGFHRCS
jgi:hypothetical protein